MLRKLMVVVLLACVGLTAGVAFGTLFSGNGSEASIVLPAVRTTVLPTVRFSCHQSWRLNSASDLVDNIGVHQTHSTHGQYLVQLPAPERLRHGAPSGALPIGDYVLFGLLAGLSAAVGFLVPPRSSLTAMR
jgi:hypothetical protein